MAIVVCSNCNHEIEVRVFATAPRKAKGASSLGSTQLKAVLDFMRRVGESRRTTTYLYSLYESQRETFGMPRLSTNSFGRALRANGATPWRTADERGWDIPAVPEDQKAAKPAPTVQAREEEDYFEAAVAAHAGDKPATPAQPVFRDLATEAMKNLQPGDPAPF